MNNWIIKSVIISCFIILHDLCYKVKAQTTKHTLHKTAQQPIKVSDNKRFLVYADGKPFFYLGDTAWELFHRLTLEEAAFYMDDRKAKSFTVIQTVMLPELDGLHTPNRYNHIPFKFDNPLQPNDDYFKDIDAFINLAASKRLYVGLLPTWGDKVYKGSCGIGPEIFNAQNAEGYGMFLGNRYKKKVNIIWILGGDRNPRNTQDVEIWRALAKGIKHGLGKSGKPLMTFHPQPNMEGGSAKWFQQDPWLSLNMLQTGHCKDGNNYDQIAYCYALKPIKPVIDGEPLYEDHPLCFDWKKNGYSTANDVRKLAYWQLFSGACGHTYGSHSIWQFYASGNSAVNRPLQFWKKALDLPGAQQMGYVKKLIMSQSVTDRIPDQSLVGFNNPKDSAYCSATRAQDGHYAFIYTPTGRSLKINTANLKGKKVFTKWFNPRDGKFSRSVQMVKQHQISMSPPSGGSGIDWVLVISEKP